MRLSGLKGATKVAPKNITKAIINSGNTISSAILEFFWDFYIKLEGK